MFTSTRSPLVGSRRPARHHRALVAVGAGALLTAACGSVTERATEFVVEQAAEQGVDVDIDGESITITGENEEGSITFGGDGEAITIEGSDGSTSMTIGGGEVPEMWSQVVSVYPGADVTSVQEMTGADGANAAVLMATPDPIDSVVAHYTAELTAAGYTEASSSITDTNGQKYAAIEFESGESRVVLQGFGAAGTDTQMTVMVIND